MTEKLDLSRVSREALEALARDVLDNPEWGGGSADRIRAEATADRCHVCGRTGDIDHGAEHMGAVEFPESICEACYRDRAATLPDGWVVEGAKAWQERGAWRTEISLSDTGNVGVGFSYLANDRHMGGSIPVAVLQRLLPTLPRAELTGEERAVLEAMSLVPERGLKRPDCFSHPELQRACDAELARRAAKEKHGG